MTQTRSRRGAALVALLGAAMVTATYLHGALAVLSGFLIADLSITRSQLGVAFAVLSLTGAATAPLIGAMVDQGTRWVMVSLFALGAAAVVVVAGAPCFGMLLVATVIGGLALGAGNPVTNRIISERISPHRWGLAVGLKQAGPPLALLVAGILLPTLALLWGWRLALAFTALFPLGALVVTYLLVPPGPGETGMTGRGSSQDARRVVWWLTVIGLGVATGISAVTAFLPLYAQEDVGLSAPAAGLLAATVGLTGVAGRIAWGALGDRFTRPSTGLIAITGTAVVATAAVATAQAAGPAMLWAGSIVLGSTVLAWHALAWLVIIDRVGTQGLGKASGIMQAGNLIGFALGPPMVGVIVDLTGSYTPAWTLVGILFAAVTVLTTWVRYRTPRRAVTEARHDPPADAG